MTNVRETKRADELKPGDWLVYDEDGDYEPNEVKAAFEYPTANGPYIHLTTQVPGKNPFSALAIAPEALFELVTDDELAELRAGAERAQKIADIRAFADWLEATPEVPMPWQLHCQVSPGQETLSQVDVWNSGAEGMAELKRLAAVMGAEIVHHDERSDATKTFGRVEYRAIAWHKDGRPAEPKPLISDETIEQAGRMGSWNEAEERWDDPTGLAYTRADDAPDDPTPISGARVPPHTGGMTDEGLVDETPGIRPLDTERLGVPGMVTCSYCLDRVMDTDWLGHARTHDPHYSETPGLIVGDTAEEQMGNAYAAYERDEAEYLPTCPECMGQHHTVEPCR